MDPELFSLVASELPAILIILIVEHIAIAKSFGRIFGYTVVPSQEMIAQGASNILSPFVGGYVCTGSFGASAVLSKAAVRTPLAGLFSALVLLLALYALTAVFFYIPNAALAGLIIHCTFNLITPPKALYKYWQFSPFELFIWICGVVIAFFTNLETAIYVTVGLSFAMLLIRIARNPGKFRGAVNVTRIVRDPSPTSVSRSATTHAGTVRQVFLPYATTDGRNKKVTVQPAYPGVFIYRFSENFNYINQAFHIDYLTTYIKSHTRRTQIDDGIRPFDRLWCDAPPDKKLTEATSHLPILKALVLDLSTVNFIDITSLQGLLDLRITLEKYAAPARVEWHFSGVCNGWTRRALVFAGFGAPGEGEWSWCPAYTVATAEQRDVEEMVRLDVQQGSGDAVQDVKNAAKASERMTSVGSADEKTAYVPLYGVDRPFFHVDLHDAVDAAVRDAKECDRKMAMGECSGGTRVGVTPV
jgi:sodium-independent sulfate anion transporter 11